jgi:hypothetical protein
VDHTQSVGSLQPLPIHDQEWESISMASITRLLKMQGKDCINVQVDRLTNFSHFSTIPLDYSAAQVIELSFREMLCLHGWPKAIISSRDGRFTGSFWQVFSRLVCIKLTSSTIFHPPIGRHIEFGNPWVEGYLRDFIAGQQSAWVIWLHLGEYCYPTTFHMSVGTTPFRVLYGYEVLIFADITCGNCRVPRVRGWLPNSQDILRALKENLRVGRSQRKMYGSRYKTEGTFEGVVSQELPHWDDEGQCATSPEEILQVLGGKFHDRAGREYLVKWQGLSVEDATWENEQVLQFLGLNLLEDKQIWAGRTVMSHFS